VLSSRLDFAATSSKTIITRVGSGAVDGKGLSLLWPAACGSVATLCVDSPAYENQTKKKNVETFDMFYQDVAKDT